MWEQYEPFSAAAIAAFRDHPDFFQAVRLRATASLAAYNDLDEDGRWQISDLGRAALTGAAIILNALGAVTAEQLIEVADARKICSRGRVLGYLDRAQRSGLIVIPPGEERWTKRPLGLTPRFHAPAAAYVQVQMRAAARLAPHLTRHVVQLAEPAVFRRFVAMTGVLTSSRPDLFGMPGPIILFMGRDGGMRILDQLIAHQPEGTTRLVEALTVSNARLARLAHVSRPHVKRLFADGVATGALRREGRRLELSVELAQDVENYHAAMFELFRVAAQAAQL